MTTAKSFRIAFDCANDRCKGQAIVLEAESKEQAEKDLADIYDMLSMPILATCPDCNQTRRYYVSETTAYIQEIFPG